MMENQGLGIFLKVLFGIGGITILIFIWTQPSHESQRMFSTLIGSLGLLPILVSSGISMRRKVQNIITNN
jgi:hypothetical protein